MANSKMSREVDPFTGLVLEGVKETGEEFGVGAYGRVFAVDYYGTVCAAKEVHPILVRGVAPEDALRTKDNFLRECLQCAGLRHPNMVQFLGVYYKPGSDIPILVMERMDESLRSSLERYPNLPLSVKLSILLDVSLGLRYLHYQKIVHRDLSSNNVLLTSLLRAKISDLGVAKVIKTNSKRSLTKVPGTTDFMPPESLIDMPVYDTSLDVFSYGGVVLHTATQDWPTPSPMKQYDPKTRKVRGFTEVERRQTYLDKMMTGNTKDLTPLAISCLDDDPNARPTMTAVSMEVKRLKDKTPGVNLNPMSLLQERNNLVAEGNQRKIEVDQQKRENEQQKRQIDQQKRENDQQKRENEHQKRQIDQQKREIDQLQMEVQDKSHKEASVKQPDVKQPTKATNTKKESPEFGLALQSRKQKLKWITGAMLPTPMWAAYATVINSTLYISGGVCPNDHRNMFNVYKYQLDENTWTCLPRLQQYRGVPVNICNQLTIIGGKHSTTNKLTNLVVTYRDNKWISATPNLTVARLLPAVVSHDHYIIVAGGQGDDDTILPLPMWQISATASSDSLMIVGYDGADNKRYRSTYIIPIDDIITSKPAQKTLTSSTAQDKTKWSRLADAPYWRTAIVPNTAPPVIIGGSKQDNTVNNITMYDDTSNSWQIIASLPINLAYPTVATINNTLIVLGGCTDTKTNETCNATALSDVHIGQLVECDELVD